MRYEVQLVREARLDLQRLGASQRAKVKRGLERYLRLAPTRQTKSRIKRLRQPAPAEYRLRIDDLRVFYVVEA